MRDLNATSPVSRPVSSRSVSRAASASASISTSASRRSSRLRRGQRGRRVRSDQSAAQARAGRLHPARLQRARCSSRRPSGWRCSHDVLAGCPDLRHVVVTGRRQRDVNRGPAVHAMGRLLVHAPSEARPSRHRHRHGGDPLHVGQHRQAEGRRAVPSQHGGRREERRLLPRATMPTTRCSRRCRCRSTPASASSPRPSTPARAWCAQLPAAARRAECAGAASASPA